MILLAHTVGTLAVKSYIIGCPETREAIVVDPGGGEKELAASIKKEGLYLVAIVNTHGHPDHTAGNAGMKRLTGAPVLMHEADDRLFRDPSVVSYFRAWGFEPHPPADGYLSDGEELRVGTLAFRVLHTPGHSPGSICLYGHGHLVTGDTLFVGAAGRVDLPGGSFETLISSLREKIAPLPDETVILPGHDYGSTPTSTIKREKQENPYLIQAVTSR